MSWVVHRWPVFQVTKYGRFWVITEGDDAILLTIGDDAILLPVNLFVFNCF